MIDLVVITVIVTPAIPSIVLRSIGAAEMINTIRFPTLCIDLRPFHHGVTAKGGIRDLGSRTVDLLGIVVRIEIVIDNTCISQHTRTRHELFTRIKRPTAIIELTGAEIHSRRSKCGIIHIRRISYSSGRAGSRFHQIVTKQIISLLRGNTGSVRLAAIIGTGTGVRECGIVIYHADRHISICISAVCSDVLEQFALRFTGWITSSAPADNRTGNATRKLRRDLNLDNIRCRDIYRLSGKLLHRPRFVYYSAIRLVSVVHALCGIRECGVIVSSGARSFSVSKACGLLNVSD